MGAIDTEDPIAVAVVTAIRSGDVAGLRGLLATHHHLAEARLGDDDPGGMSRSLLHVATDWPGHFPNGPETVRVLVEAGADVNARFRGPHEETPLHWAASSNDVAVLDALLDLGAEIDASGGVIAGATPLRDATAFGNHDAAMRLIERGASVSVTDAATLGMIDFIASALNRSDVDQDEVSSFFWSACHGGQLEAAQYLLSLGADRDWIPSWENTTPLDAAARRGVPALVSWLHSIGAETSSDISGC